MPSQIDGKPLDPTSRRSPAGEVVISDEVPGSGGATSLGQLTDVDAGVGAAVGSLLAGDGSEYDELLVGADGLTLIADSGETLGLRWGTAGATDHGALTGLADDDHLQYLLLAGRAGGQTAFGGTADGNNLVLQGNPGTVNTDDVGRVHVNSPVEYFYGTGNTTPAEQYLIRWRPTFSTSAYIGGYLRAESDITYTSGTYIPGIFVDAGFSRAAANPGFSAYTFINLLHTITNSGNFNLVQGLVMNVGLVHERTTSGTSTVTQVRAISFSPQSRATVSGAVLTRTTGITGVTISPTFSTVAGSTVNMGTIRGLECLAPAVALFQPEAGTENLTAYYGIDFANITFATSGNKVVVRSAMTDAANRFFLQNNGGARSNFGGGNLLNCGIIQILADNTSLSLGAAGGDVQINWNGSALEFDPIIGDDFRIAFASGTHTITTANGASTAAILFGHPKFAFGQTSSVGNQKGIFVANAETITIGGEYSQFLLTQAANDTINAALSLYAGWTINAPSPVIGSGSLTTGCALNVGGNPTGTVNRVGIRIISNPTGGSGINAALWVTAGLSRFDGRVDVNNGIALGAGAGATLGTIGGSGPTAAAQAQWLEIDIGGTAHWIPVWT